MKNKIMTLERNVLCAIHTLSTQVKEKLDSSKGSGSFDVVISVLISIVLGALLIAGLYLLIKDNALPGVKNKIDDIFNFEG